MRATVRAVQPYELHGTQYYRVILEMDGEDRYREARLSHDMAYPHLAEGDAVQVHAILGIIDRIEKIEEPSAPG